MKQTAARIFLTILMLLTTFSIAKADSAKPLLFVGNQDYPPMVYLDKGVANGFYVDVTEALARKIGRKIDLQLMNWQQAQQMVQDGKADAVISLSITDDRKTRYDFSDVVTLVEFSLFLQEGAVGIIGLHDLEGKRVAVFDGGYPHNLLRTRMNIILVPVTSHLEGFQLLQSGGVTAFATDKWVGSYTLQRHNIQGITLEREPFAVQESAIAVKKGNRALLIEINVALRHLQKIGEIDRIRDKWSRQKIFLTTQEKIRGWAVRSTLAIGAALLILLGLWIFLLKRQIQRRKKADDQLQQGEMRYRSMVDAMTEGFALHEMLYDGQGQPRDYRFIEVNPAFERITGLRHDDVIGKTMRQALPGEDPFWIDAYGEVVRTGQSLHFEHYSQALNKHFEVFAYRTARDQFAVLFMDNTGRKQSEDSLRVSEYRYRELFNRTSKCVIVLQPIKNGDDFIIADLNQATLDAENVVRENAAGRRVSEVFPTMQNMGVIDTLRRVFQTDIPQTFPVAIRQAERIITWCEYYIYKLPTGEVVALYEYITERKRMEEALRLGEKKYRDIVDNIVEGIYQALPDGSFRSVNQAQARLYGYESPQELMASITDIRNQLYVDPARRDLFIKLVSKDGVVANFEFQAYRKDGSKIWVSNNARVVRDEAGNILYFEGTNIDVTTRRQAEEELAHACSLNKEIIASVAEGIIIYDRNLRYQLWNPFMERLTGIREDNLLGTKASDYPTPLKDYGIDAVLQNVLNGETIHFPPFPYDIPKSGKKGWAEAICTQQRDDENNVIGVIVSIRDITDKRQMEERLQRATKMEALGLLAGGVAHDLNNVIGISLGHSELMLEHLPEGHPLRIHATSIMKGSERAAAIVQDLLTMARRGVAVNKVVNLNRIVSEYLDAPELIKVLASHPEAEISTTLEPGLLNIKGSPIHLGKALVNLIMNAAEAMRRPGRICIKSQNIHLDRPVKGYDSFQQGDYAVLTVSDEGEGIAADHLDHIFEPFYTRKAMGLSGTGLGLAVVWGTVKDHRGYIDVTSDPGRGTTFSLYFPVVREELTRPDEIVHRAQYMGKGETLLVVDDMPEQRELATSLLGKLNYLVASTGSGEDAVEFLKKTKVDLVVLDMIMDPGIDGLETYRRISEICPGQKAVIVSGFAETKRVSEAQKLGVGAYVKKPYILEHIGKAVRCELDGKR